jgi:hypothetical protein
MPVNGTFVQMLPRYSSAQAGGRGNLVPPDWAPRCRDDQGRILRVDHARV